MHLSFSLLNFRKTMCGVFTYIWYNIKMKFYFKVKIGIWNVHSLIKLTLLQWRRLHPARLWGRYLWPACEVLWSRQGRCSYDKVTCCFHLSSARWSSHWFGRATERTQASPAWCAASFVSHCSETNHDMAQFLSSQFWTCHWGVCHNTQWRCGEFNINVN